MKEIEVFKKGNVWGFSFEVYEDEATTEDNRKTSISTRISKTGYTTKEEAITASVVYKAHFFKMPPVTEDDIKEDYALFELIEYGLFTSEDISKYIDYLVNIAAVINNDKDNDDRIITQEYIRAEDEEEKNNEDRIIIQEGIDYPQEYYDQMAWQERTDKPIDYKEEDDIY